MSRLLIAVLLAAVAALVAVRLSGQANRRRRPVRGAGWTVPAQLERRDFERPEAPWLVVLFSSSTCEACAAVWERAQIVASDEVAVHNVDAVTGKALHEHYRIDAVPLLVIVDADGAVRRHFLGPVNAADLWGALAELR